MTYKEDHDICLPSNLAIDCLEFKTWSYRELSFFFYQSLPTLCSHMLFSNSIAVLKNRLTPFEAELLSWGTFV